MSYDTNSIILRLLSMKIQKAYFGLSSELAFRDLKSEFKNDDIEYALNYMHTSDTNPLVTGVECNAFRDIKGQLSRQYTTAIDYKSSFEMLKLLASTKAINSPDRGGATPLVCALQLGDTEFARAILFQHKSICPLFKDTSPGISALYLAFALGDLLLFTKILAIQDSPRLALKKLHKMLCKYDSGWDKMDNSIMDAKNISLEDLDIKGTSHAKMLLILKKMYVIYAYVDSHRETLESKTILAKMRELQDLKYSEYYPNLTDIWNKCSANISAILSSLDESKVKHIEDNRFLVGALKNCFSCLVIGFVLYSFLFLFVHWGLIIAAGYCLPGLIYLVTIGPIFAGMIIVACIDCFYYPEGGELLTVQFEPEPTAAKYTMTQDAATMLESQEPAIPGNYVVLDDMKPGCNN